MTGASARSSSRRARRASRSISRSPCCSAKGEDAAALDEASRTGRARSQLPSQPTSRRRQPSRRRRLAPAPRRETGNGNGRIFASPLARRMAQQAGLDLAAITGSGPQGRIVKADIEAALALPGAVRRAVAPARPARPAATLAPAAAPAASPVLSKEQVLALAGNPPYTERPHTAMRRVIARRLTESKQTVPHFYLTVDCEIDELLKIRAELNAKSDAYRISVNDFVIRAAALALRQVPAANASWSDEAILLWERVDIAVAVALDDGLITPIVKSADQKGLATDRRRDQGPRRARPGRQIEARRVPGRHFLDLEPRHVRGPRVRRGHQPAAWRHPGGRRRRAAAGRQERRACGRDGDELHACPAITGSSTARSARNSSPPSRSSSKTR